MPEPKSSGETAGLLPGEVDPGGRLQDIADAALRRRVAQHRGARGAKRKAASAKALAVSDASTGQSATAGAQSRMVALDEARGADIAALQAIIDGGKGTLNADRIRALDAKQRMLSAAAVEQSADAHSDLVALRDALLPLPEAQRVDALTSVLRVEGLEEATEARSA